MPDCLQVVDVNAPLDRRRTVKFDINLDVAPRRGAVELDHATLYIVGRLSRPGVLERVMDTKFGIIPVVRSLDGKLMVQREIPFPSEEIAKRAGEACANIVAGAIAFRRVNDPDTGLFGQGIIIGKYGIMAEESAPRAIE